MKTLPVILLSLVFLAGVRYEALSFRVHTNNTATPEQNDKDNSSTFYITGTGVDTSLVLAIPSDDISLEIVLNDTSASGDSAQVKVVIMSALYSTSFPSSFGKFLRKDSVTVSNETLNHKLYLTPNSTSLPRTYWHVIELTGGSDNKKLSATTATVTASYVKK